MISYSLNLQKKNLLSSTKTNVVNNYKDILMRFKEKICPAVHIFIAIFFVLVQGCELENDLREI